MSQLDIRVSLGRIEVNKSKRIILLTDRYESKKTSIFRRTIRELNKRGHEIGETFCHEVREAGTRVAFEIMNLSNGQRGWLTHVKRPTGPKIGKYTVNLTDLDILGVGAILDSIKTRTY